MSVSIPRAVLLASLVLAAACEREEAPPAASPVERRIEPVRQITDEAEARNLERSREVDEVLRSGDPGGDSTRR